MFFQNKKQKLADKKREESEMINVSFEDELADLEQKLDRGNVLLEETTTSKRKLEDEIQQLKNAQRNRTVMFGSKAAEVCCMRNH
jgi:peptidoglycan hydrolase CwlO-like protein